MVDTRADALEERVQRRLEGGRPAGMSAVTEELAKFKADFLKTLVAPIAVLKVALTGDDIFD